MKISLAQYPALNLFHPTIQYVGSLQMSSAMVLIGVNEGKLSLDLAAVLKDQVLLISWNEFAHNDTY